MPSTRFIADAEHYREAYIGSANLTGAGCKPCGRRPYCPDPIE